MSIVVRTCNSLVPSNTIEPNDSLCHVLPVLIANPVVNNPNSVKLVPDICDELKSAWNVTFLAVTKFGDPVIRFLILS